MGIGVSVFLIAAGLILALAVHASVSGLDIQIVGWILVAAGILGLVMTFTLFAPRRRAVTGSTYVDPAPAPVVRDRVVEERRVYDDRAGL